MFERDYAITRRLDGFTFEDADRKAREALAAEGFGIITEIDVQAVVKKKLGLDRRPYRILGACNPSLSHRALEADPTIGVFLPCNVDLFEAEDGSLYLQAVRPSRLFQLVGNPAVEPVAREVDERLERAVAAV